MLEEFKDSFLWQLMTEECIDLVIWRAFFAAIFTLIILGYIAKWIKEPVERMYQHFYQVKMRIDKEKKREKS